MNILVTAEYFGFGPIMTCINIIEKLKEVIPAKYIFLGSGISKDQAIQSKLFDEVIECKTYDVISLKDAENFFKSAEIILSVENLQGAVYAVKNGYKAYYVDNLFWMWKDIPKELEKLEAYFVVDMFDADANIKRIGNNIENLFKIGPLRMIEKFETTKYKDRVLFNVGGGESFLSDFAVVCELYTKILNLVTDIFEYEIIVCGGKNIVNHLKERVTRTNNIKFESYDKETYLKILAESKYVVMAPGLGNYIESLGHEGSIFLLPPINYSQFLQIEKYRKNNLGYYMLNWNDFPFYYKVDLYEDEPIGVGQVLENIKLFLKDNQSINRYKEYMQEYFSLKENWGKQRECYYNSLGENGIDTIIKILAKNILG